MEGSVETVSCVYCKAQIDASLLVCPKCGATQRAETPPPPAGAPPTARPKRHVRWEKDRPTGVTIIAVLMILGGIWYLMGACVIVSFLGMMPTQDAEVEAARTFFTYVFPLIGIFNIVLAIGLLYMKQWARIVAIIVNALGAALVAVSMAGGGVHLFSVLQLVINGFVAFYLIILGPEFSDYYED